MCHVISSFHPVVGGAERATLELCTALVRAGTDVCILTRRQPETMAEEDIGGLRVFRAGVRWPGKLGSLSFGIHALWILGRRLTAYRIVHVQNIDAPLLIGIVARVLWGRRLIATIHGEMMVASKRVTAAGRFRLALMRRFVHHFTAISERMQAELKDVGVPRDHISVVPNGVDVSAIHPPTPEERRLARRHLQLSESSLVGLFVGRLVDLKRVDLLLCAWSDATAGRSADLLIVGDGPERSGLERLAAELDPLRVHFHGMQEDVRSYLRSADIFVLPSRQEGLSVALMEAMASGLPVVVSDLPGNRALVRDSENGLVVPPEESSDLIQALHCLAEEPEFRTQLGSAARATIEAKYALSAVAVAHQLLYRKLGSHKAPAA